MGEERRHMDGHQGFVEPRRLTLDYHERDDVHAHSGDANLRQESESEAIGSQDPLARPYANLESTHYPSPGPLPDTLDLNVRGGSRSPFLWSGDYGPNLMEDFPPLRLDDWGTHVDERPGLGYDGPPLPPLGFPSPFPGVNELLGHPPSLHPPGPTLPPLHSFAPLSPFPYESNSMDLFQLHNRGLHLGQPEPDGGNHLPLLPAMGNYLHGFEEQRSTLESTPPPVELPSKKVRVDKRNTKPLTVEDLLHDNSRFAKVVKAFLSIEDQENRTVPEIAKRVSEMYAGQYADFEGVKRMVNDVLQKHKAFWHPGRGSPYQLNLNEGRARREFPSNSRRLVRNRYDGDLFYSRGKRQKRTKQPIKKSQGSVVMDSLESSLFQSNSPHEGASEGDPDHNPDEAGTYKCLDHGVIDPSLIVSPLTPEVAAATDVKYHKELDNSRREGSRDLDGRLSPERLPRLEPSTAAQADS